MEEQNTDRRVRKTRAQLRQALTALLRAGRERKEEADGALPPLPEHRKDRTP